MRRHQSNDQSGTTLVELTVVLLLVSVVGVVLFGFLWSVQRTTTRMTNDTQSEKAIQLALRPVTANIRGASAIATAYPSSVSCSAGSYPTGYSNCLAITIARPAPGQLTCPKSAMVYGLRSDGILREDRTDYALVSGVCAVSRTYTGRRILTNVVNGSTPLFTYFDAFGNKLDPGAVGQTANVFAAAVTVRASLSVRYALGSPLLTYTSDLAVRNNR
jgi:type II secretory pathway pseudopilin PulG